MKWAEGKYEHRGKHTDNYYAWLDLLHVMLVTLFFAIAVACLITLLVILMNPTVATAGDIVNFRTARRLAAKITLDTVTTRASEPVKILYMEISAYSASVAECDSNPTRTASGKRVYVGGIAADLRVLPFGSRVIIPNYNNGEPCTVVDTGSLIRGNTLDVFFWKSEEARQWGRRHGVRVEVLYIPKVSK